MSEAAVSLEQKVGEQIVAVHNEAVAQETDFWTLLRKVWLVNIGFVAMTMEFAAELFAQAAERGEQITTDKPTQTKV